MMEAFRGTEKDPITGRMISNKCWNCHHNDQGEEGKWGTRLLTTCEVNNCDCACHDWMKP